MTRSVRAGLQRESIKSHCASTDSNQGGTGILNYIFHLFEQFNIEFYLSRAFNIHSNSTWKCEAKRIEEQVANS